MLSGISLKRLFLRLFRDLPQHGIQYLGEMKSGLTWVNFGKDIMAAVAAVLFHNTFFSHAVKKERGAINKIILLSFDHNLYIE